MQTYHGQITTPGDAILLFEACRQGILPRVQRRLSERERAGIKHGSVFIWDEREAGMRRWTDGKSWSASRVVGPYLTYREIEGRKSSSANKRKWASTGSPTEEHSDTGDAESFRYKTGGLLKQSYSITTTDEQRLHLVSYLEQAQDATEHLIAPTRDHSLAHLIIPEGLYPDPTGLHEPVRNAPYPLQPNTHIAALRMSPQALQHAHPANRSEHGSPTVWVPQPNTAPVSIRPCQKRSPRRQHGNPNARLAEVSPSVRHAGHPYDRDCSPHTIRSPVYSRPAHQDAPRAQVYADYTEISRPAVPSVPPDTTMHDTRGPNRGSLVQLMHPSATTSRSSSLHRRHSSSSSFLELPPPSEEQTDRSNRCSEERRQLDALHAKLRL
jgi:hypothetical protein